MAYARFSDSDVYVFFNSGGWYECCGCRLPDPGKTMVDTPAEMVAHLRRHEEAGHDTGDAIPALEEEAGTAPMG